MADHDTPDGYLHLYCNRATGSLTMACQEKEPESRNIKMGTLQCRGTKTDLQGLMRTRVLTKRQRTVKFINDEATSIHGNLKVASVYTSESGEWKLGGFEVLSNVKDDDAVVYVCSILLRTFSESKIDNFHLRPMEVSFPILGDTLLLS